MGNICGYTLYSIIHLLVYLFITYPVNIKLFNFNMHMVMCMPWKNIAKTQLGRFYWVKTTNTTILSMVDPMLFTQPL